MRVLLDCGQFYAEGEGTEGDDAIAVGRNRELPFEAGSIDAVLVSHVHLDHIGRLPALYSGGFRGPIYLTRVSAELAREMLIMAYRYGDFGVEEFYGSRRSRVAHTREDCEGGTKIAPPQPDRVSVHPFRARGERPLRLPHWRRNGHRRSSGTRRSSRL